MCVAGEIGVLDLRAVLEQQLDQRDLHARPTGMRARRDQAERRGPAAVHLGLGIDLGARVEQDLRDPHDVLRRFLAISLDPVGRHVVQQRGIVLALRACADQLRPLAQQSLQRLLVAVHDRLRGGLVGSARVREGIEVCAEFLPALESVGAGEHELRVSQHAGAFAGGHRVDRELLDLIGRTISRPLIGSGKQ